MSKAAKGGYEPTEALLDARVISSTKGAEVGSVVKETVEAFGLRPEHMRAFSGKLRLGCSAV